MIEAIFDELLPSKNMGLGRGIREGPKNNQNTAVFGAQARCGDEGPLGTNTSVDSYGEVDFSLFLVKHIL